MSPSPPCPTCGPPPQASAMSPPSRDWLALLYVPLLLLLAGAVGVSTRLEEAVLQWVTNREGRS